MSSFGVSGIIESMIRPFMSAIWVPSMYAVIGSIGVLLAMWHRMDVLQDEQVQVPILEKFDFIVGKNQVHTY